LKKRIITGLFAIFVVVLLGGGMVASLMSSLSGIIQARVRVAKVHNTANDLQVIVFETIQGLDRSTSDETRIRTTIDRMASIQDVLEDLEAEVSSGELMQQGCGNCHDNPGELVKEIGDVVYALEDQYGDLALMVSMSITEHGESERTLISTEIMNTMDQIHSLVVALHDLLNPMLEHIDQEVTSSLAGIKRTHDGTIIMITLLVLMGIGLLLRSITKPIKLLSRGTEAIVKGDYNYRITMKGRDELAILAERFNYMAEVLSNREKRLHQKKLELEELNETLEDKVKERTGALRDKQEELNHKYLELESANEELQASYIQLQSTAAELEEAQTRLQENYDILKTMNQELQRANEVKNKFLSIMSHELRTPLTVINGYLSLVLEKNYGAPSGELRDILTVVKEQGMNQLGLIEDLLDLTRIESGEFRLYRQSLGIGDLIGKTVENFRPKSEEKKIDMVVELEDDLPTVYWDFQKMLQVLQNLVDNALKFTPAGGRITLIAEAKSDFIELKIKDNGIGIPREQMGQIFDRFYQVDSSSTRRFGGSGLGLSIVREIIHAHNGKIFVESEERKGTTFLILMPLGEPEKFRVPDGIEMGHGTLVDLPQGQDETILVVDDDESFLQMMKMVLPRDGYNVHITSESAKVVEYARQYDVDLIMLDLMMPDVDGYETCRRIRRDETVGHVPLIVVSAAGGKEVSRKVFEAGADEHVTKPFEQVDLLSKIHNLLHGTGGQRSETRNDDNGEAEE
jgi:signal transduction histidine kinase/CheY-like chemotaxis protein/HAMP domain-containing protein